MLKEIEKMLEERFGYPNDTVYCPTDANDIDIFDAVVQMFIDKEFPAEDFSVEYETVFESTALDIGVLSVAFIDWGKLYHENFIVECR